MELTAAGVGGWVALGIAAVVLFAVLAIYNTLVRLRNLIKESWSDVETELKRRHELIPNLVAAVKGYMKYEKDLLEKVTRLRSKLESTDAPPKERARDESELARGLKRLFAVVENYPELKASRNLKELQDELVRTEDRIQAARRFYNGNVRDYNIRVESVPSNLIAALFGFEKADYFEIEEISERDLPKLDMK